MLVQCLRGERVIEFGKNREIKYKFRKSNPDDPTSPALCIVTDPMHLRVLVSQTEKFEPFCRTEDERAEANAVMAEIVKHGGVHVIDKPELPFLSLSDEGEDSVRIELELPRSAYQGIVDGTLEFDIIVAEDRIEEPPAGGLELGEAERELIDGGTKLELLAYCRENLVTHNRNWPEDKLRSAVREHKLLPQSERAA